VNLLASSFGLEVVKRHPGADAKSWRRGETVDERCVLKNRRVCTQSRLFGNFDESRISVPFDPFDSNQRVLVIIDINGHFQLFTTGDH
jgi:hypothetical protein